MADHGPSIIDQWLSVGVLLPLRADPVHVGSVVDAEDNEIFVVDQHGDRDDAEVRTIAAMIAGSVNIAAGVTVEAAHG